VREIQEETGLQILPERLIGVYSPPQAWTYPNGDQVQSIGCYFRSRVIGISGDPDPAETRQLAWLNRSEIMHLDLHPMIRPVIQAVLDHLDEGYFIL
jgi:8-oxo-dGTP pyrophosphatase MutT (NUDIX family)